MINNFICIVHKFSAELTILSADHFNLSYLVVERVRRLVMICTHEDEMLLENLMILHGEQKYVKLKWNKMHTNIVNVLLELNVLFARRFLKGHSTWDAFSPALLW